MTLPSDIHLHSPTRWRVATLAMVVTLAGCGGGGGDRDEESESEPVSKTVRKAQTETKAKAAEAERVPSPAKGRRLIEQRGCTSCHTTDGASSVGPTWQGLAGSEVTLVGGETVVADEDYLARSIREPDAETVDGFPKGAMAGAMPGKELTDTEIADIVAYLQTLG